MSWGVSPWDILRQLVVQQYVRPAVLMLAEWSLRVALWL